jgi:hypothetical protein
MRTDAANSPTVRMEIVTHRIRHGVSHENRLAARHARSPVAPVAAVIAPAQHCMHTPRSLRRERSSTHNHLRTRPL